MADLEAEKGNRCRWMVEIIFPYLLKTNTLSLLKDKKAIFSLKKKLNLF